ncbi:unnamed protein product [Cyclocybe aegerita]|uniref:Uncharacterized protein n=1 Tax=Cyclocybe aegerita TaxID=1973307 RepID=A0A8S0X0D0_CYCAE|nr:unnamed protein product [Cyclocybe aegerita]
MAVGENGSIRLNRVCLMVATMNEGVHLPIASFFLLQREVPYRCPCDLGRDSPSEKRNPFFRALLCPSLTLAWCPSNHRRPVVHPKRHARAKKPKARALHAIVHGSNIAHQHATHTSITPRDGPPVTQRADTMLEASGVGVEASQWRTVSLAYRKLP